MVPSAPASVWVLNWCKLVPERAKLVLPSCVWVPGAPCGSASVSPSMWLFLSEVFHFYSGVKSLGRCSLAFIP